MKEIRTQDAVGRVLLHDLTRISAGGIKETAFRKGHVVREEDVEPLLKMGKMHLFVSGAGAGDGCEAGVGGDAGGRGGGGELGADMVHENDAAEVLAHLVAEPGMRLGSVKEGKIEVFAHMDGVLRVDRARLAVLNGFEEIMVATRHDFTPVRAGDKLAGTRIIPLAIARARLEAAERAVAAGAASPSAQAGAAASAKAGDAPTASASALRIFPYTKSKAAIVTTGSEVYENLIEDSFTPVVRAKLAAYGARVIGQETVPDTPGPATEAIRRFAAAGAEVICVTGGMSVDPDDRTPAAIRDAGCEIVSYGAPVLPGAMFLTAYLGETAVLGLPGCVMHSPTTIFDILLPRVLAGLRVTKDDLAALAVGGLCLLCETCTWPVCGFGAV